MDTQSVRNIISAILLIATTINCGASLVQYPRVLCPEIFEYAKDGNNTIGIITVRNVKAGRTRVEIEMSQSGTIDSEYRGSVSLNFNKSTFSVALGSSITYRVDFPLQNVTPQVNAIRVNGEWECWGQKVPLPSATLVMEHILNVLEPNSSLPTQNLEFLTVIPRPNGIKFQIPKSMRRFYDKQLIRLSFEDLLVLSNDQRSSEHSHKPQNTHLPVESVQSPGKNETENVLGDAPTTTTARPFSPTSTTEAPLITHKLVATTTTARPFSSSSTSTTTMPTPLQKVKPTPTQAEDQHFRPECIDNPLFANCHLIVKGRYCSNKYYQHFCCQSCTLDGQVPS